MSSPKKYQIAIPHQQDLPSERVRKAFRDVNGQFDQIATDVSAISTQVSTLATTAAGLTTPPVQVLPTIQPIAQPAAGTTSGVGPATTQALFIIVTSAVTPLAVTSGQNTEIRGSATGGADQVVDLPASTGSGFIIILKKMDANPHNNVLTAAGADLIDGLGTYTLTTQYSSVWVIDAVAGVWDVINVRSI